MFLDAQMKWPITFTLDKCRFLVEEMKYLYLK